MSRRLTVAALVLPAIALLAFGFLYPFFITLFVPPAATDDGSVLGKAGELVGDPFVLEVVARTIRVAAMVTGVCLLFGFPVAYLISQAAPRRRGLLLACAIFPLLLSNVVRTYAWLVVLGSNGLISELLQAIGMADAPVQLLYTEFALVVGLSQLFMPILIMTAFSSLSHIDTSLEDAARGLGASAGKAFRRVVLPLALPGVLVGAVLVFSGCVTAFTTPMLLGGTQNRTLATLLYNYANVSLDWHSASAIALFMTVIVLAVSGASTWLSGRRQVA